MDSVQASQRDQARMSLPPQRLSALYQYHNAPEVAPAHGLEYDDTIYPVSDKYPVIRESPLYDGKFSGNGRYHGDGNNRPPRIIFGMKIKTFLVVALAMSLVVVGAAVGGAVGGRQLRDEHQTQLAGTNVTNTALPATGTKITASPTSTFAAPTPTYEPLNDCPASNNTDYISQYASTTSSSSSVPAGLAFTKFCDLENPLSMSNDDDNDDSNDNNDNQDIIAQAFVYSFSDCIEICAAYNYAQSGSNCTVAVYEPSGSRPGNCWIGNTRQRLQPSNLRSSTDGTNVAILQQ